MRVPHITLSNIGARLLDSEANIKEKRNSLACLRNPGSYFSVTQCLSEATR